MSARTPYVSAHWLYDVAQPSWSVRLDTPAWVSWLDTDTTTRFAYPLFDARVGYIIGRLSVRKERRQRGTWYWTVYHRSQRHLSKVYVGPSASLTQARLDAIAHSFLPDKPP